MFSIRLTRLKLCFNLDGVYFFYLNLIKKKKQEDRAMVETSMNKSFVEIVKGSEGRGGEVVRVEVTEEEIRGNLRKLDRKEVWVKILGLPVSLWDPSILRKVERGLASGSEQGMGPGFLRSWIRLWGSLVLFAWKILFMRS
ncbi:unnamed protein product, partial [Vitis vinifera]